MRVFLLTAAAFIFVFAGKNIHPVTVTHDFGNESKQITIQRKAVSECKHPTSPDATWQQGGVQEACFAKLPNFAGRIQPMRIENVTTIGELEVLSFLEAAQEDADKLLVDARGDGWAETGTIPGSVNIDHGSLEYMELLKDSYVQTMAKLGVETDGKSHDFTNAKELVVFCNGPWCPQSGWFVKSLLKKGYPAAKIQWYRGGMNAWRSLGLTTVNN
ncbi:MAG: rhodanese-like domain-containing protein [Campylobacterota bacterium]